MKKLFALLTALTLILTLAACNNIKTNPDVQPTEQVDSTIEPTTEPSPEVPVETPAEPDNGKRGAIQIGTWDEARTTFTNEWMNLKITLPEGFMAADDKIVALMATLRGEIAEDAINGADYDTIMQTSAYDFIVRDSTYLGVSNLTLMYENVSANLLTSGINETTMLDTMAAQFVMLESQDLTYTELERGTRTIAEEEWTYAIFSINGNQMFQFYALRKVDGVMASLILTYTNDTKDAGMSLIDALTPAK